MFKAKAQVATGGNIDDLVEALENIANDLVVDINL
jgi:hypothetical protein